MLGARMFKTLGCVILDVRDARPGSNCLRSFASRSLAGKPLVDWVVRRATEAERLDGVVVILPNEEPTQALEGLVPPDVMIFTSDRRDELRACVIASKHSTRRPWCASDWIRRWWIPA